MSQVAKLLVLGSGGSGKSTFLSTLAGTPVDAGGLRIIDYDSPVNHHQQVSFEVSSLWMPGGYELRMYAPISADTCRDVDWALVMDRFHGVCLLIDNRRPRPLEDLKNGVLDIGPVVLQRRVLVGVTHCDVSSTVELGDYRQWLEAEKLRMPVFKFDPRSRIQSTRLLQAWLSALAFSR